MCKKVLKYQHCESTVQIIQHTMNEFKVMNSLIHPCICHASYINFLEPMEILNKQGKKEEMTTMALFLEFVDYNLSEILKMNINNTTKAKIVLEIVHAMDYLHKNGLIHRDLKIENIMVNSLFETKLVDFGLVRISEAFVDGFSFVNDSLTKGIGTLAYMSPEMVNKEEYDGKTDVYSFGIVLHFIFVGNIPEQTLKDKLNGKDINLPSPSDSISSFCIKLISQCLSYSPSNRPSFEDILNLMRENLYEFAPDVDPSILSRRDKELEFIENYK